jgi:hypothetical protein
VVLKPDKLSISEPLPEVWNVSWKKMGMDVNGKHESVNSQQNGYYEND